MKRRQHEHRRRLEQAAPLLVADVAEIFDLAGERRVDRHPEPGVRVRGAPAGEDEARRRGDLSAHTSVRAQQRADVLARFECADEQNRPRRPVLGPGRPPWRAGGADGDALGGDFEPIDDLTRREAGDGDHAVGAAGV